MANDLGPGGKLLLKIIGSVCPAGSSNDFTTLPETIVIGSSSDNNLNKYLASCEAQWVKNKNDFLENTLHRIAELYNIYNNADSILQAMRDDLIAEISNSRSANGEFELSIRLTPKGKEICEDIAAFKNGELYEPHYRLKETSLEPESPAASEINRMR